MKTWTMRVLMVVFLVAGCDSGGDSSAEPKCNLLVSHFCTRVQNCQLDTIDHCKANFGIDCSKAVEVGAGYDTCIAQVDALACNQLTAPPTSCAGVISVKK